jgi:DNA-binding YbaB/EbfC family protein
MRGYADVQTKLILILTQICKESAHPHIYNNMFDKLMEAQQKAGEVKKRLDAITVTGTAEGGKISVQANGNKVVQSVSIDPDFFKDADKEELEELLVVAINKAIEQAENLSQTEMAAMTQAMLGGMGGLGNLFGK